MTMGIERAAGIAAVILLAGACGAFTGSSTTEESAPDASTLDDTGVVGDEAGAPDVYIPDDAEPDASIPTIIPSTAPAGFPSHVTITPPSSVPDMSGLCAIDTDAPSYTICVGTVPVEKYLAPSNFIADHAWVVLWTPTLVITQPVTVTGSRALVVAVAGDLTIAKNGGIDVSANGTSLGPGALDGGAGAGTTATQDKEGPGGGGYGTGGAQGGLSTVNNIDGDPGGKSYGADAAAFAGGSPGGVGFSPGTGCGAPGAGGGAIQISAYGTLTIVGTVRASGSGGQGGCFQASSGSGEGSGGGGGSGGEVFVEALTSLNITGTLAANGGGGGGGGSGYDQTLGGNGSEGPASTSSAAGGSAANPEEGAGGSGGALPMNPAPGQPGNQAGGGGGAAGRIWIRKWSATIAGGGVTSPAVVLF